MIRVGIFGAGVMGDIHAASFTLDGRSSVAGFFDPIRERARGLARKWKGKVYKDPSHLLKEIDVAVLTLPSHLHREFAIEAAKAGKAIFCEKPLALSSADGKRILKEVKKRGVTFMVGHVVRFFPEYAKARALVAEGRIGTPGILRLSRNCSFPRGAKNWFADSSKSGGIFFDLLIHDLDFLRWTFGEVKRVYAASIGARKEIGKDHALVTLRFDEGCIALVQGSWMYPQGTFFTNFELAGSEGILDFDSRRDGPLNFYRVERNGKSPAVMIPDSPLSQAPYQIEISHFLDTLTGRAEPVLTGLDALRAVQLAEAAWKSARTRKPFQPERSQ